MLSFSFFGFGGGRIPPIPAHGSLANWGTPAETLLELKAPDFEPLFAALEASDPGGGGGVLSADFGRGFQVPSLLRISQSG